MSNGGVVRHALGGATFNRPRRWGRRCLHLGVALALLGHAEQLQAAIFVAPVVPFYEPYFFRPERYIQLGQQYYELSLTGLQHLCREHPETCGDEAQQATLRGLTKRRTTGIALTVLGIAAALGGSTWTLATRDYASDGQVRSVNVVPLIVGVSLGVALPLVGGILIPHDRDMIDFINASNAAHPKVPIELRFGHVAPRTPGLTLSMRF